MRATSNADAHREFVSAPTAVELRRQRLQRWLKMYVDSSCRFPNGFQSEPLIPVRIVHDLALVVEDHRGAIFQSEGRPIRKIRMVRIPAAGECGPRRAHLVRERVAIVAGPGHGSCNVDVVKREWN